MTDRGGRDPAILADVGGTNTRLALTDRDGALHSVRVLQNDHYAGLGELVEAYLRELAPGPAPRHGALAIASPVIGDRVTLTNRNWSFSIADMQRRLRLARLSVVNDFTAVALSIPRLGPADIMAVGGGRSDPERPIAVLGPGTGLGVSGLVPASERWIPLATEGGHATLAPGSEREAEVARRLRARFGHASAERALSGPGLVNLYTVIAEMIGAELEPLEPASVSERALTRSCPLCVAAVDTFCDLLGSFAGNLALTFGARGGVYIAGGVVPRLGDLFQRSGFRRRFEDKGRFSTYLADVPTHVILAPVPAFLGLAAILEDDEPGIAVR